MGRGGGGAGRGPGRRDQNHIGTFFVMLVSVCVSLPFSGVLNGMECIS